MNNQGIPPPGFYPPGLGFNTQPAYPNLHPQPTVCPYPQCSPPPYPVHPPSAPEFTAPPPYNPEYQPSPQPPVVVVVTETRPISFGRDTVRLICPHCQADVSTRVEVGVSTKTHIFALILCLLGLCLCIPCAYCGDCFAEFKHYCPSCRNYLGSWKP